MIVEDLTEEFLEGTLDKMSAEELIKWAFENFGEKAAIGTSFQLSGSVIIDIASKAVDDFRIFTVDTCRLHPETEEAISAAEDRYGVPVERFKPDAGRVKEMVERFGEYLFFDDKAKQEYCCSIRKVEPNTAALETLSVWITGLRRDQSKARESAPKSEILSEWDHKILKLSPLIDWTAQDVWKYVRDNDVPYNTLFDKGYDSVGCIICSTPLNSGEAPRSGRWRWFNGSDDKKECGIHIPKKGEDK